MEKRIITILEGHDQQFVQINQQFEQVDKRFEQVDKRFEQVDKRFEQVDKRFDQIDQKFDRVFNKLLDHDKRLDDIEERMATKEDIGCVMAVLDKFVGLYVKTDQEQLFMGQRVNRVEDDVKRVKIAINLV